MNQTTSRLALLMQLLGVTGRELGIALHVDHSLVSKWKNNHRPIPVRSGMLSRIADYLIMVDTKNGHQVIQSLLVPPDFGSGPLPVNDLHGLLTQWLRDPAQAGRQLPGNSEQYWLDRDHYVCPVEIFQGESGRRQAVLQIFQTLLRQPAPSEILIMSQEDRAWIDEDPEFSRKLRQLVIQVSEKGHRITIIYWLGQQHSSLLNIIHEWLPLQLQQRITSYYSPVYRPFAMPLTLYVIPEQAAIYGLMAHPQHKQRHSMLFRDSITIQHLKLLYESYLAGCQPLLESYDRSQLPRVLKQIVRASRDIENKPVFAQMALPSVLLLPQSDARDLLSPDHQQAIFALMTQADPQLPEQASQIQIRRKAEPSRYVFSSTAIRNALQQPEVADEFLSLLANRPVRLSVAVFRQLLMTAASHLRNDPQMSIALINDEQFQSDSWQNLLLLHGDLLTAWNSRSPGIILTARESTLLHAFNLYTDRRWQQIPTICRDRDQVIEQLERFSRQS
ncbi:MAG: helix-turn-helix transcriptional regulator [Eubacteriales bacterium]|nr:helix-turn-helix transcriptional regulator [Eubacteriales bacterium]